MTCCGATETVCVLASREMELNSVNWKDPASRRIAQAVSGPCAVNTIIIMVLAVTGKSWHNATI